MPDINSTIADAIIKNRKSIRAYKNDPVSTELISHILTVASRAPSASNMQPWQVYILTDSALKRITNAVCKAFDEETDIYKSEYAYYPEKMFEPYLSRRRKTGYDMYALLDITKGEKEKVHNQQKRNYQFFDAPMGLIFTIHHDLPPGNFIDYGTFLENIMLSAESHGLGTCLQAGWSDYHLILSQELALKPEEMVLGGMAIGYADTNAKIYKFTTEREPLPGFTHFIKE